MHQALYRKWRPKTFDDVYGQEHITSVLKYEAQTGAFSHAYLFCGSRGTGKTTCAKILAKVVNCENPVNGNPCGVCPACQAIEAGTATDITEMDAASNNGVDNIRDIRDEVVYAPADLKYRVYIIDEVHMLSGSAFNALLKTLEEPPAHVIFVLATTELQKLPATIISRCQRFDFRRIAVKQLVSRLQVIARAEQIDLQESGAYQLARLSQGGMRDAISLLELCSGSGRPVDLELVNEMVGISGRETVITMLKAVRNKDYDRIFELIDSIFGSAKDILVFWQDLISLCRDILVVQTTQQATRYLDLTEVEAQEIKKLASDISKETTLYYSRVMDNALVEMQKAGSIRRSIAELALLQMCDPVLNESPESLLARMSDLETKVWSARPPQVSVPENKEKPGRGETASFATAKKAEEKPKTPEPETPLQPKTGEKTDEGGKKPQQVVSGKPERIREWPEIVSRVAQADGIVGAFLYQAKAYLSDGETLIIRFQDDNSLSVCNGPESIDCILGAVAAELRKNIERDKVVLEVAPETDDNDIDDIFNEG